jgi:hypothetical protein
MRDGAVFDHANAMVAARSRPRRARARGGSCRPPSTHAVIIAMLAGPMRPARSDRSDSGATFSVCRTYRYRLWRSWDGGERRCVFVGLNPSTADESRDDPTIRKCIGFAHRWGFDAVEVVNLFAYAGEGSTDPRSLLDASDPVGPENDAMLAAAFAGACRIVWAWGRHDPRVRALVRERVATIPCLGPRGRGVTGCLGRSQDGSPRHPLRIAYATRFEPHRP